MAVHKCAFLYACKAIRYRDGCKANAFLESIGTDTCHTIRNGYRGKAPALIEGVSFDTRHRIGDRYARHIAQAGKRKLTDSCDTFFNDDVLDGIPVIEPRGIVLAIVVNIPIPVYQEYAIFVQFPIYILAALIVTCFTTAATRDIPITAMDGDLGRVNADIVVCASTAPTILRTEIIYPELFTATRRSIL